MVLCNARRDRRGGGRGCRASPIRQGTIRIVAPSTPGDAPDVIARLVADRLSVALGQQVVVENRPGAGGVVGSEIVAKSAPDGYTLIMGNAGSHGINAAVYSKLPYDILKDFAPVSQIAIAPNIFVVNPGLPVHTIPGIHRLCEGASRTALLCVRRQRQQLAHVDGAPEVDGGHRRRARALQGIDTRRSPT
jgi:hypothetical protein